MKSCFIAAAALLCIVTTSQSAHAEESGGIDWTAWQRMPVLEDGRIMPLDSYARARVKKICGEVNPSIGRLGTLAPNELSALSPEERVRWTKESQPRRFLAAELVYAWTVDPKEKWDDVPFLYAANTELRSEYLGVPMEGEDGSRLNRVSPRQVRESKKFPELVDKVQALEQEAQQKKLAPQLTALQQSAKDLAEGFILFEQLRFDPARDDGRRWLGGEVSNLSESWQRFHADLLQLPPAIEPQPEMFRLAQQTNAAIFKLIDAYRPMQKDRPALAASDAALGELRRLSGQLSDRVDALAKKDVAGGLSQDEADEIKGDRQIVARSASFVNVESARIRWALYDAAGEGIFLMPALEPTALEADRHRSEMHPWISLRALLEGSPDLLSGYPQEDVERIRDAWNNARAAYLDLGATGRASSDRAGKFAESMRQFTGGVRAVSEAIEPQRLGLPIIEQDKILLAKTAYPRAVAADAEVIYNKVDPFHWAWIASLAAAAILAISYLAGFKPGSRTNVSIMTSLLGTLILDILIQVFVTPDKMGFAWGALYVCGEWYIVAGVVLLGFGFARKYVLPNVDAARQFRNITFWLGITTMLGAVGLLAGGFAIRIYITHWAPVTSMFETMVWVSMCVALLTLWANFLPLLGPTSKTAWSWTAIPGTWEDKRRLLPSPSGRGAGHDGDWNGSEAPARAVALTLRLILFVAALYIVGVIPALESWMKHASPADSAYGVQDYALVSFMPRTDLGATLPGISSTFVWLASLFVAGTLTWYVPRLIPSALMAIGMSFIMARRPQSAEAMEKIYSWRVVAMAGAIASFIAALTANYAPFPRDIQALMPVLRSNFWLGIHVLTITSSYAAVAASWVIGNVALGWYVFGKYRTVERLPRPAGAPNADAVNAGAVYDAAESVTESTHLAPRDGMPQCERRPPAFCGSLANLNYRVVQISVLLLAAGTILGGLWADVSWGRFWGWDPKEVGALIALLILLTAVHGRRAGWPGDLTLAIGSVMGFFGVLWAWYVVNFLLNAGLHSYGAGEGGRWVWLVVVVGLQISYILAAVIRVSAETGQRTA